MNPVGGLLVRLAATFTEPIKLIAAIDLHFKLKRSAGQKKDLLGAKVRELIALAVAVTARYDGCTTVHTDSAIKHGATEDEVAEALG